MDKTNQDDRVSVYEIGYLIATSVPEEKVPGETEAVKKIVLDAGAGIIAEEAPHRERLAYTMSRKTMSGAYDKYGEAYFGWIKFDLASSKIEAVKKQFENHPSILRMLLLTVPRENTYLGKRASAIAASFSAKPEGTEARPEKVAERPVEKKESAPMSIADVDKSIDELVKEV